MPSVKGKGSGGRRNEAAARNGKKVGRPPTHWKIPVEAGRAPVLLNADTLVLAQRLMLHEWPGVQTIEDLIAYAVRKLAETNSERPG